MKILLAAVNAKYIHSNPGIYSLKASALNQGAGEEEICLGEYTINQEHSRVLADIYRRNPEFVGFSCYIWNISFVLKLAADLVRVLPQVPIWLGGPEVSYHSRELLEEHPFLTGIMRGEGEAVFPELISAYREAGAGGGDLEKQLQQIPSLTFRTKAGEIFQTPQGPGADFAGLPFSYEQMGLQGLEHRIVYYESSRGCPFSCSYCLSSLDRKVRLRPVEKAQREIQYFLDHQVPQVKLIDRTFNCSKSHAMALWTYIRDHDNGITNFHFEIGADLLDQDQLELLSQMRPGLVQLEIGVQSTNEQTLKEIRRHTDLEKIRRACSFLGKSGNIHRHLDLIAGLPWEDFESFQRSFNQVYAMKPEQLQLGFLKVLKGSYMEEKAEEYGLVYSAFPPYEVLSTRWISYQELLKLKAVEEMLEIHYNSGQFTCSLKELEPCFPSPFQMFWFMAEYYRKNGLDSLQHSRLARYEILWEMAKEVPGLDMETFRDLLTVDLYLREYLKSRPGFLRDQSPYKDQVRAFFGMEEKYRRYLPDYQGRDARQLEKMARLEILHSGAGVLFDYRSREPLRGNARTVYFQPGFLEHLEEAFL